jgi:trimeric autotransporter adhesin
MRKILFFWVLTLVSCTGFSQSIGIGTATPNASAVLDITNSSKGLLIPRMTTTAINAISNPAKGLLIYDSTTNQLMVNMGTPASRNWQSIASKSSWNLGGNSGINVVTQFVGTNDNRPLRFRVNGIRAGELSPSTGNVFLGLRAGESAVTGYSNVAIGTGALQANTVLGNLVAIGDSALFSNTIGDASNINYGLLNTAVGSKSLYANTTGFWNTATGYRTLFSNTTGWYNSAYGVQSLYNNTSGPQNTAFGVQALFKNTTGGYNTAMGFDALYSNTGQTNTAVGYSALAFNSYGGFNTAVGADALQRTTASYYNTAIGYQAGQGGDYGWNNVFVGMGANATYAGTYNSVAIGQGAMCTGSSQVRIGNTSTVSIGGQVGWSNLSDGRYKKNVREDVRGIDFIMKLRPVTYQMDVAALNSKLKINNEGNEFAKKGSDEQAKIVFSGFIAQEVEESAKELGYDFSGVDRPKNENDLYALRYAEFVVPLVKAMQEQQHMINDLKKQNEGLQKRIGELEKK